MGGATRVICMGLGPIGAGIARLALDRGLELVGAVDVDPDKVGRDAAEVMGRSQRLGLPVVAELSSALASSTADMVLHATSSTVSQVAPQILECVAAGCDVVTTTEELAFAVWNHPDESTALDRAARQAGATVLATGANPGFLMDTLPLVLSGICHQMQSIQVRRVIDASRRRGPFQVKIGAGRTVEAFVAAAEQGMLGHVGLAESAQMILDTLGWRSNHHESSLEPLVATEPLTTNHLRVEPGQVRGLCETLHHHCDGDRQLSLHFEAVIDAAGEGDSIRIRGIPDLELELGGANGDLATAAMVVNAVPRVRAAPPGLVTMRDLAPVVCWSGSTQQ